MHNPPTGTVTFLFTDIEGSTSLWERQPSSMKEALQHHDNLLRQAIEQHGGHVFKTVGDAFCAAFSTPLSALEAALAMQTRLAEELPDIAVRAALHTGMSEERGGDYFGPTLNRVARLLSAGHGGQTLLSCPTYDLVRDYLPGSVYLLDMGEHRLKDLIRPERVFQLAAPGLLSQFAPLKTLDHHPNNLPMQHTELIGREKEVASVVERLHQPQVRLLTLTGPGGIGKTRLALQAGAEMLDDYKDGVYFINLAPITDSALVMSTIAQTLGTKEAGGTPILDTLKGYLQDKELLLLLDNFEQVVDVAPSVNKLIEAAPGLKVLVTSRVPLRVQGEYEFPVLPLSLPDLKHLPPLEKLTQYEAVRLFIERATGVKPDFQVTNENAPAVAEICTRLDGLPLAIELAAARIRLLPPQAMLSRLQSRLKLLTGGARDLSARQQTLRGAIEWSYDLLSEGEKQLLRRLAVFVGGRTLEAIEAVCNANGDLLVDVLDGTESLLSQSLLRQQEGVGGEPRYVMLETIHEYAREKLQESGEREAIERQHVLYFTELAERAESHLMGGSDAVEWLNRLEDEHDNMRAAVEVTRQCGDVTGNLRLCAALFAFWNKRGYWNEGRSNLETSLSEALASKDVIGAQLLAPAHLAVASLMMIQGDYHQADPHLESSLTLFQSLGDKAGIAGTLRMKGVISGDRGDYVPGSEALEWSLAIYRELGDKRSTALLLRNLAITARGVGDNKLAREYLEQALAVHQEIDDRLGMSYTIHNLGFSAFQEGDFRTAMSLYEQSLQIAREAGDKFVIFWNVHQMGVVAIEQEEYERARSLLEESLALAEELGAKGSVAAALGSLGYLELLRGNYPDARSLTERSLQMFRRIGEKDGIAGKLENLGWIAYHEGNHPEAREHFLESIRLFWAMGNAYDVVASLVGLASLALARGQDAEHDTNPYEAKPAQGALGGPKPKSQPTNEGLGRAARLCGAVEKQLELSNSHLEVVPRREYERLARIGKTGTAAERWEAAWREGHEMSLEEAIAYALDPAPNE